MDRRRWRFPDPDRQHLVQAGSRLWVCVIAVARGAVAAGAVPQLAAQAGKLPEARKVLQVAIDNTDMLLELLSSVDL
ncbi:DUF6245 family protein [Micromonospora sp. CPCC 206061]|uniref:DUF6245 family protein n=1 Tax=Micromonospora sp. CPCC 206061 TaxID=3122410 RepID=UPI003FA5CEFB